VASKQREQRLIKLTLGEMSSLPDDAMVYEGVGKMYVMCACLNDHQAIFSWYDYSCLDTDHHRFASLPVNSLKQKLDVHGKDIDGEVEKLNKRLLYLETTQKNSREHIEQMLRGR
jgi:chaperonin cofactor prefoldin